MDISETVEVKGHEKCIFETPYNEIKCVLSVKESNFNEKKIKIFTVVRAEMTPFYGQHDRKISAFFTSRLRKICLQFQLMAAFQVSCCHFHRKSNLKACKLLH